MSTLNGSYSLPEGKTNGHLTREQVDCSASRVCWIHIPSVPLSGSTSQNYLTHWHLESWLHPPWLINVWCMECDIFNTSWLMKLNRVQADVWPHDYTHTHTHKKPGNVRDATVGQSCPPDTYPVVPVWFLLPQTWFSLEQPKTAHLGRRCLPEPCRLVRPTPPEPCRNQSRRWRRNAACSGSPPQHPRSFCSDQSLPPMAQTGIRKRFPLPTDQLLLQSNKLDNRIAKQVNISMWRRCTRVCLNVFLMRKSEISPGHLAFCVTNVSCICPGK